MSNTEVDLAAATGDFEQTAEEAERHAASVRAYEEAKKAKLAAKGLSEAPEPKSKLEISFRLNNLIREKAGEPIPEDVQKKIDEAIIAYLKKNLQQRKRFSIITFNDAHSVAPFYGNALRDYTLTGIMDNKYSSEDLLDEQQYEDWLEENEEEEEEEEEEDDEEEIDPSKYAEKAEAAIKQFIADTDKIFEKVKEIDAVADAEEEPAPAYRNLRHILKLVSTNLESMGTV